MSESKINCFLFSLSPNPTLHFKYLLLAGLTNRTFQPDVLSVQKFSTIFEDSNSAQG